MNKETYIQFFLNGKLIHKVEQKLVTPEQKENLAKHLSNRFHVLVEQIRVEVAILAKVEYDERLLSMIESSCRKYSYSSN